MSPARTLLAVALACLPWGCISLPEQSPAPERYVLEPLSPKARLSLPVRMGVRLVGVHLPAGLASDQIAVIRGERHLDHLAQVRWAAPLPDLLRDYFLDSMENRWGAVAWGKAPARYRLEVAVRDFQAEYPSGPKRPPLLRVHLVAFLLSAPGGKVLARASECRSRKLAENRIGAVVQGLEDLLGKAFAQILERFGARLKREQHSPVEGSVSDSSGLPGPVAFRRWS